MKEEIEKLAESLESDYDNLNKAIGSKKDARIEVLNKEIELSRTRTTVGVIQQAIDDATTALDSAKQALGETDQLIKEWRNIVSLSLRQAKERFPDAFSFLQ